MKQRAAIFALEARQSIVGVQYLRGIAALMVVFHHARWFLPTDSIVQTSGWGEVGSRGVDIFFVISGFVMAHSTQDYDPIGRVSQAIDFYGKRLIRVVPLYWIAVIWTAKRMIWNGEEGLDLAKDFLFVPHFNDHGHGMIWPYLYQGWTINYEMFFYALFALSMLVGRYRYLALSASLLVLVSLGVISHISHPQTNSATILFYTSNLLFEFLLGVWLNLWMSRHPLRLPRAVLAGVAVIGFGLLWIPNSDSVRGFADGIAAVLIVWSIVLLAAGTELGWLRGLGDASYSIYLFHVTIVGFASWLFRSLGLIAQTLVNEVMMVGLYLVLASIVGVVIHRLVEKPLLRLFRSTARRWIIAVPRLRRS